MQGTHEAYSVSNICSLKLQNKVYATKQEEKICKTKVIRLVLDISKGKCKKLQYRPLGIQA